MRRWAFRALSVAVLLVAVMVAIFYVLARSATSRWERLTAELRDQGAPLTFAEIQASRPPIPEDSNGALAIHAAAKRLEDIEQPDKSGVFMLDRDCNADFFDGITRNCVQPTRDYVEARQGAFDELARVGNYQHVRHDISYEGTMFEFPSRLIELGSQARALARLANSVAILKTIDGDNAQAREAIVLQLRLSEPLYAEPELISLLVATAIDALAVQATEGLLRANELTSDDLIRLQGEWERLAKHRTMKWALLGERAHIVRMTIADKDQVMAEVAAIVATANDPPPKRWRLPNPANWIPFKDDWFLYENGIHGVTILSRLVGATDKCSHLLNVAKREQASLPRFAPGRTLIRISLPVLTRSIELHARSLALFRCIPVALAAERFRLTNGRFPRTTYELVPDYLTEVASDPFVGQPLRLVSSDEGIIVYSVGENMTDDGGQVVPQAGERLQRDFGVRLLTPSLRGLEFIESSEPSNASGP
ncbi:MAG: hypothetical protein V3W34_16395 [Phycisphaerae bacterium]